MKKIDWKKLGYDISRQISSRFSADKILLFGSCARGKDDDRGDIDICVVVPTNDKRKLLADLYFFVECEKPVDFLVYTPPEWEKSISDKSSFAFTINTEGFVLHDRQQAS